MNKADFLKTEFGAELENCIITWDNALEELRKSTPGLPGYSEEGMGYKYWKKTCDWCQAQWEIYQLALKQFCKVSYHFTRTDEYFGLVTENEADWLMKVERRTEHE